MIWLGYNLRKLINFQPLLLQLQRLFVSDGEVKPGLTAYKPITGRNSLKRLPQTQTN